MPEKPKVPHFVSILGAVTACIAALTPLYLNYFDNTVSLKVDRSDAKVDLAYELLAQRVEHNDEMVSTLLDEIKDLRTALRLYTFANIIPHKVLDAAADGEGDGVGGGGGTGSFGFGSAGVEALTGKEEQLDRVRDLVEPVILKPKSSKKLPESLDAELEQRQK